MSPSSFCAFSLSLAACVAVRGHGSDDAVFPGREPPQKSVLVARRGVAESQASVDDRMLVVPGATYEMADQRIGQAADFRIDLTEVTVARYAECVRDGVCVEVPVAGAQGDSCNGAHADRSDYPENCVDWRMADAYCRRLGKRLPTEEEWEYAACGDTCQPSRPNAPAAVGGRPVVARPVTKQWPGFFGLFDLSGDAWEWTASEESSSGRAVGEARVVRTLGWWLDEEHPVFLTDRAVVGISTRRPDLGFRCAQTLPR